MKNSFKIFALALLTLASSCHEPDELTPSVANLGLNSISAQFATGNYKNDALAKFTATVTDASQERIVVEIPYYYPESTTNQTAMTDMRVTANLDDNCFITPSLSTLDLTKENWFTLTRANGAKKQFCITGEIKKSNKCLIEEFSIPDLNLTGVIDNDKSEISIIALGELQPALAKYRLSYHATISPDPAAVAQDYNGEVELTVTAHDGVTKKVYTVKKNVPNKVRSGIRTGSGTQLWKKTLFANIGIATVNMTGGIAVTDKYILLNTRNENSIILNRSTGEKIGEYTLPAECKGGLVNFYNTADRDGNILLCNLSPGAGSFKIWRINPDLQSPPRLFIEWAGGLAMGRKISVQGSIDKNAIITAPIHAAGGKFARWQVIDGALVSATPTIMTISGATAWSDNNVDIVYTDESDLQSDFYATYYVGGNTTASFNGQTNALISKIDDVIAGNFVSNSVDYLNFNNRGYMCFSSFNGFTWGGGGDPPTTDCCWMLDADEATSFKGSPNDRSNPIFVYQSEDLMSRTVANGNVANGNTTGDIAFYQSPDGYMLYMYVMITNGWIVAWQFDCIDR